MMEREDITALFEIAYIENQNVSFKIDDGSMTLTIDHSAIPLVLEWLKEGE